MDRQCVLDSQPSGLLALGIVHVNRGKPTAAFAFPIHVDAPGSPSVRVLSQCQDTA